VKITTTMKTLALLGLTTLTLAATSSQADSGNVYYGGNPGANPWLGGNVIPNPAPNPWMNGPAYQQARFAFAMRERLAQFDQRQDAQLQRILGGMENGKLTLREATALLREHLAINALERKYSADGRLGPNELVDLERRLEEANRHIKFETNDREQSDQKGRPDDRGRSDDRSHR